jgi:hypothetical protein
VSIDDALKRAPVEFQPRVITFTHSLALAPPFKLIILVSSAGHLPQLQEAKQTAITPRNGSRTVCLDFGIPEESADSTRVLGSRKVL